MELSLNEHGIFHLLNGTDSDCAGLDSEDKV